MSDKSFLNHGVTPPVAVSSLHHKWLWVIRNLFHPSAPWIRSRYLLPYRDVLLHRVLSRKSSPVAVAALQHIFPVPGPALQLPELPANSHLQLKPLGSHFSQSLLVSYTSVRVPDTSIYLFLIRACLLWSFCRWVFI